MSAGSEATPIRVLDVVDRSGQIHLVLRASIPATPGAVADVSVDPEAEGLVLWDEALELPDLALVARLLAGPCHVWHAGLSLGQAGRPLAWNTICHGRAMLSCDVQAGIESTSWKVSVRAVIVRNEVVEESGGLSGRFDTLSAAALEAGLRWTDHGALVRHVPALLGEGAGPEPEPAPTVADGTRIVRARLGTRWGLWSVLRGLKLGAVPVAQVPVALRALREPVPTRKGSFGLSVPDQAVEPDAKVTVLVPTVGRYPYLEPLLVQLSEQTRLPDEVVVVDQNPAADRRDVAAMAPTLPIRVLHLLPPGQCSARNVGLQASTGSHILFLDDDDEIPADLIERHLEVLACPEVAVSCGLVDDAESGPAPASLRHRQAGTTFPTNNAMVRRSVLEQTGLFDPTYDRGARADHDLGMRSYLAGNLHVYDPQPHVFHHHAPMGGLRTHGARVRTRGNSRSTVKERHLRTSTDIYLGLRYHSEDQVREDLALSAFATLSGGGTRSRRLARAIVQVALLPSTLAHSRSVYRKGKQLLCSRPELPTLKDRS